MWTFKFHAAKNNNVRKYTFDILWKKHGVCAVCLRKFSKNTGLLNIQNVITDW